MRRRSTTTVSTASSKPCSVRRPRAGVVVELMRRDRFLKLWAKLVCARLTWSAYALRSFAASSLPHPARASSAKTARRTGMTLRIGREATRWDRFGDPPIAPERPLVGRRSAEEDLGHLVERRIEELRLRDGLGEVGEDDVGAAQRDHRPEPPLVHGADRADAEARREHAVVGRRRAAALDVAEDRHAGLEAGPRLDL